MAIAVFDDAAWRALYPELAGAVSQARAALLFVQAGLYLDNTDASPVADPAMRLLLLDMIVAHLATVGMTLGSDAQGNATLTPSGVVGRVSSATEGSVSVTTETGLAPGSAGWWAQTTYGFDYWAATARYRRGFYAPAAQPSFEPFFPGTRGFATWPR
jgi:hypothetical protein